MSARAADRDVVDWAALGETALAAIVGGTVFTLAFSLAIVGASRGGRVQPQ